MAFSQEGHIDGIHISDIISLRNIVVIKVLRIEFVLLYTDDARATYRLPMQSSIWL